VQRRLVQSRLAVLIALLAVPAALAQSPHTEHTLKYDDGSQRPAATLADVAWLAGHWRGEGLGGLVDEVWTPPFGGSMTGLFKLVKDGAPDFYEILTIVEEEGTLLLRLKHFHADLKGWEEKDDTVDFRLVKIEPGKAWFGGLTFLRQGEDGLSIYVGIRRKDGTMGELEFVYRRFDGA
jgi:hypothetical protein